MLIWQIDLSRSSLPGQNGQQLWELLVCDANRQWEYVALCPQADVNSDWLFNQLKQIEQPLPTEIQVFRPQSLNLIKLVAERLGIKVKATRRTLALKQWLAERSPEPVKLDRSPPVPLPENLWGDQWQFASLPSAEIGDIFLDRPIPILEIPSELLPLNLGLASTVKVPGVIIYGGKKSLKLAQWLQESQPVALNYQSGDPDGLILEASLADRWVVATFSDPEVKQAAKLYEQRKQKSQGLHFLLVQPDDSGITYSGVWLLQND